jgi:hypothetical protein
METILELSIMRAWLDDDLDDLDTLLAQMTTTEMRAFQGQLLGLIDHLAVAEDRKIDARPQ